MVRPKEQLGKLIREGGDLLTAPLTAKVLGISNKEASKILSRWTSQGWLTHIRRGLYAIVPIEATDSQQALEEAWVLIPELYTPCYVGGWSAAEYWDFTEQLFRNICVLTERPVTHKNQEVHNISFSLTHIVEKMNFGTQIIWKKNRKIQISDPNKTIIDMLYNPQLGGGMQHIIECFREYFKSTHYDPDQLIAYAVKIGNGAIFKRLGFLSSKIIGEEHKITQICREHMSKGITYLDPSMKEKRMITRWRLYVPEHLQIELEQGST